MKKIVLLFSLMLFSVATLANNSIYQHKLVKGDPGSMRSAAKHIINKDIKDTQTIDVAMEVLLQNAGGDKGKNQIDALAWVSKAIGASKNARYSTALTSLSKDKSIHKKIRKYAKKAAKAVGKPGNAKQYTKGSVNLAKVKAKAAAERAKLAKTIKAAKGFKSIAYATEGMSASELSATCGPPTSTTSHITGKQFIPFNFKGGDTIRTIYLYKGQGQVTVTNNSAYSSSAKVIDVTIDPSEPGFR